jgi:hypothetical protein
MELEDIKTKLNKNQYNYFLGLEEQIELPLYFIGSITRSDYLPDKSDFDIEIFTDNILSTKLKVEYLFNSQDKPGKIIYFYVNNQPVSGLKYYFKDKTRDIKFDFAVYNNECKELLLHQRKKKYIYHFFALYFFIY